MSRFITLVLGAFLATSGSAGALDGWAVGETHRLDPGVFYRDFRKLAPAAGQAVGVLPVALDREVTASFEYGDRTTEFEPIIHAMQDRLRAGEGLRPFVAETLPASGAPRVYVGSAVSDFAPFDADESQSPDERFPPMILHLERPSKSWQESVTAAMAGQGLEYVLLVNVAVSQYPKGRRGIFAKNVLVGTGHEQPVQFLTAEDKLLEVLQVTGLLVDARGRVVRAGAEGVLVRDTPFLAQAFEVGKTLDDKAPREALATERRRDLPGAPLSVEVALDNLVGQLLKDPSRIRQGVK